MSRSEVIEPHWHARLLAVGVPSLSLLLESAADVAAFPGRWEPLVKPGLGTRERWRWDPPKSASLATVYVKRYGPPGLRGQWDRIYRQASRHSRAFWEFERSRELAEANIAAPRAVAFVEEMRGALERRSAVLLEAVAGEPLDRLWLRLAAGGAAVTRGLARHDFAVRLGRFVAAFHGTGLCHRDLYLCHIFATVDPECGTPPHFAIIDLARTHRPRLLRLRWLVKDLAQMDYSARQAGVSRTDRLRVLCAYLGLERTSQRVRWYARKIARKADSIQRRAERRAARRKPPT